MTALLLTRLLRQVRLVEGGSWAMFPALMKLVRAVVLLLGATVLAVAARQEKTPNAQAGPPSPGATLPVERQEEKPAVDRHGDPLPPHAVTRLGTLRFRLAQGVWQAAAVPGGKRLLGLGSRTVVLWDATTGKEVRRFEAPAPKEPGGPPHEVSLEALAVSPDGKTFAVAGKRTINNELVDCPLLLFDVGTGRKVAEWPGHKNHGLSGYPLLAFVTPTLLVSAGDDGSVRLWDTTGPKELRSLALPANSHVSAIVASPDCERIFVAGWDDKGSFWTAWEVATGKLVHQEKDLPGAFVKLALSPDGKSLALAMGMDRRTPEGPGHTEMRLYAVPGWKERRRWQSHEGDDVGRCSIVFSPDGKTIATGGADGKVRRWDAGIGKEIGTVIDPCQQNSQNVAYLDAATLCTFGFQATVKFWDAATGKPKIAFAGSEMQISALAYSPDGHYVAVGGWDAPIRVWEAANGQEVASLWDRMGGVACLSFSPDGKWIVSGDYDGGVRLWDWAKGGSPIKKISDSKSAVRAVAISSDGKSIATGDEEGMVRVWAVSTGKLVHKLKGQALANPSGHVSSLAFTPDGHALFSSSLGNGIREWNLATGKEIRLIETKSLGHSQSLSQLVLSPGGRWGYSSSYDGSICVWEASSGRLARVLKEQEPGHDGPVAIALSRDGTRLAAAFSHHWENPSVHLWDLTTGQKIAALAGHRAPVSQLAFSPDGHRLASGSYDTTALVWDVTGLGTVAKVADGKALAGLWKDLGAAEPKVAYAAVCQGAATGDSAVARLKLDLKPSVVIDTEKVAAWVRLLDSDEFAQREKASEALAGLGPSAEATLREALEKAKSPEVKRGLELVLEGIDAEHRRLGHAVEVLEMIGTPAARQLLGDLAKGASGCRLTREARVALDRLQKRP